MAPAPERVFILLGLNLFFKSCLVSLCSLYFFLRAWMAVFAVLSLIGFGILGIDFLISIDIFSLDDF